MGLQGEAPLGVLLDILNAKMQDADIALGIACVARLKVEVEGGG